MMLSPWLFLSVAGVLVTSPVLAASEDGLDWWKTAVFYQIYPRSFMDSDGDGTGDLKGITSKMQHLKDLGVSAVWMSPILKSPMADFGYDISNFYEIDSTFGTMEDYMEVVKTANNLGIKIIMDLVPNHSSDESEWFKQSKLKDPVYDSWYIWRDPLGTNETTGKPIPPNEWIGAFNEPVWTYVEERKQFYYHRYNVKQPDLNFRNMDVRKEMENVIGYWLDKGAHGFRVDSIITLVEDESFPNVPQSENDKYSINQPLTYQVVQEWRKVLDTYAEKDGVARVMMTEAYGELDDVIGYYGTEENKGAHFTFNFNFITNLTKESTGQDVADTISEWVRTVPTFSKPNWVIGNHDNYRVATSRGNELAAGYGMLTLLLPGIGVIYNGEEIGMVNNMDITYEETLDPAGVNAGEEGYLLASRDFERTPFQWDDSTNAGFSTGPKTWLPISANYKQLNLAHEKSQSHSYYHIYKRLMEARLTPTIREGTHKIVVASENVVAISRDLKNAPSYMVIVNTGDDNEIIDLIDAFKTSLPERLWIYTASIGSGFATDESVPSKSLQLNPKSSVVLTSELIPSSSAMPHASSLVFTLSAVILVVSRIFI